MMTIILYGLYSMFNQTQKSFRANNAQVNYEHGPAWM